MVSKREPGLNVGMDATTIAVAGTLGGVLLSSVTGVLTAIITSRSQRILTSAQLDRERTTLEREERRSSFVAYLEAYDTAFATARVMLENRERNELDSKPIWSVDAKPEMGDLQRAYLVLCITAGRHVREAANNCLGSIWSIGEAATQGSRKSFESATKASNGPRNKLREVMREELGVST